MPQFETRSFGSIAFEPESVLEFPEGLPGFENRRRFVGVRFDHSDPLLFLQSLDDGELCFITMPILAVDPAYRLEVGGDDLQRLGLAGTKPEIGRDVLVLAVLSMREEGPTANLLAPVVVNLKNRKAVQAVAAGSDYSHQHPLFPQEVAACS